ncbi:CDP-diacylglycerol--serine O-phosphatidyltransferase [Pseudoduganella eburnea]|jgi:CDP-diacylglycerol--serine O-phosphatidyltransferase|uniref:CDP-diacylglycerol--serine O-phosphatidyltransferase n=1 Tax=Massilia eburnea TaxID=1776165 RepID=A0A6L6QNE2_9BURK|nr:CDP-diacylglycerol--serine O-phosphatidyltransferase [Massilia eburnea]MTW13196.1 CDP-diacylglycerol--serine O-phosphatidyltransferase [Massilia eburnea]
MAKFPRRRPKNAAGKQSLFSRFARRKGEAGDRPRSRGIYLLPNAFTTGALFCGFFAIVMAMNQRFEHAAWAIFVAMLLDGLDGRVARLTNTQSEFGAQYDSLSDMVSFGAAPALVIYEFALRGLGKLGWIAAFVYCAGAALRLARFNTNIEVVDKRYFQGLPSPAAASLIAGFVMLLTDLDVDGVLYPWEAWVLAVFAGLSMVSNVPFYSFKDINFRKSVPFLAVFLIAMFFALISIDPPKVLFVLFVAYGLSGYVIYLTRLVKGNPVKLIEKTTPEDKA